MRMVKFILQLLMLAVILFTVTSITEGATPSVMASTSIQGDISFSWLPAGYSGRNRISYGVSSLV